ncbi:MAG: FAD-dependent oxidoreductase [Candidatus Solibacter usitatus]|nr:FAD-dependent oxidoreductase [Candidatus Solibacter usitatus]
MLTLTIDNRQVSVAPGTTVLEAARRLGIRIPTLCHVPGLEPVSSCFVCAVQIEGRRGFSPSCAMPAAEGMVVTTASTDIRKARKMALELLLSDHAGDCVSPCSATCPAGLDIAGFMEGIARRDVPGAMEVISRRLALPGALGRICPRLCEQQCRRLDYDQGLAIGALHRYVADEDGRAKQPYLPPKAAESGKTAAIVGAGPAGLAAAFYLVQMGHRVTVFDAKERAGGMLRYAIPAHRLPREALDAEIGVIEQLGVEFRMGQRWGRDFRLADLRKSHDAVFLAIGAQQAQELRCEGEELALPALEFLEMVAAGNPPAVGEDVVVIGGGNTAIDCARAAVRLKTRSVRVLYRRTRQEMPCLLSEADEAQVEGVEIEYLLAPVQLERNGNRQLSLTCQRMELGEPDASGRRRPVAVPGSEFAVRCSTVIAAIGQAVEHEVAERDGLRVTGWGIAADPRTMATNLEGVFAGGDAVLGADLAVRAVAAGRMAAVSMDQYLRGQAVTGEPALAAVNMKPMDDAERAVMFRAIEQSARVRMPEIDMARRRTTFDEVETGLPAEEAEREARRCLSCGCSKSDCCHVRGLASEYQADAFRYPGARRRFTQDLSHPEIVYEPGKCILCEACVRIAAEEGEEFGVAIVGRGFDVTVAAPFGKPIAEGLRKSARRCAEACPSAALALRSARTCGGCGMSLIAGPSIG